MLIDTFFNELHTRIETIRSEELEQIEAAAELCADSISNKGVVHIYDTGHLVSNEMIGRAGGLTLFSPFSFGINVNNPNPFREQNPKAVTPESEIALVSAALDRSNVKPGDVLIIGSVSGYSATVVELALEARRRGVKVISVTGYAQAERMQPQHPCGKRLFEVSDISLDNHTVYGDAMIPVEGLEFPICPFSGLGTVIVLWAMTASVVEKLLAQGIEPTVYQSVHLPDGFKKVQDSKERYMKKGY